MQNERKIEVSILSSKKKNELLKQMRPMTVNQEKAIEKTLYTPKCRYLPRIIKRVESNKFTNTRGLRIETVLHKFLHSCSKT